MNKIVKITAALTAMIMLFSLQINVFAEEQVSSAADQPSSWASEGIKWSKVYGLATDDMQKNYTSSVTREELYSVCESVYEKVTGDQVVTADVKSPFSDTNSDAVLKACAAGILNGSGKFEPQKEATRLDMVTVIYNVIKAAQPDFDFNTSAELAFKDAKTIPEGSRDIVKYAVYKGILKGRSNDTLDLRSSCSRQELIVFAKNAYEFIIYEEGRDSKGAFWKVSDKDSSVYLLGSIHVADWSMYPLSKDILNAYDKADFLAVEANITNEQEVAMYMLQKALYKDDNTLYKNVPKEVYDRFVEAIKPYGIKPEFYNKFKPWYAALLVQNLQITENSLSGELGIDMFFLEKAAGQKDILEIEGAKFQVDLFDSFSNELQVEYLAGALAPDDEAQEEAMDTLDDMIMSWKTGDTQGLEKLVKSEEAETSAMKEFNEKLWNSRDTNMAEKVKGYLADPEGKTYFVVVGAGHMVGKTGIVAQLGGEYEIEQIK
ncbi:TraB/GumN family protein [Acetivibrio cellulolyticus]|uniref:TraB/GumN family protein n=1 Tax=Acetivibrio cellulolyticus TaxID=35830 RepID=UPI0001E2F169|nr:TraB/GumN family protein [Acetivibrio cellulolyticus]